MLYYGIQKEDTDMGKYIEYNFGELFPNTRLSFQHDLPPIGKRRRAMFLCSCGKLIERDISWVKNLNTTSCGCYRAEVVVSKNTKHSQATRLNKSGAYRSWQAMHQRCKSDPHYVNIVICERWCGESGFINFLSDMGDRPSNLTIERIDNSKGYEPSNCIWANRLVQANNSINTVKVTINDETHSISEWCRIKNITYALVKQRRNRGLSLEDAITTPINQSKQGRKICQR